MTYTYTYTARDKHNPEHAATFTIVDDHLRVNLADLDDQLSGLIKQPNHMSAIVKFLVKQSTLAIYKMTEWMSGPVHIHDVSPSLQNAQFSLVIWKRVVGLKLAPMMILFQEVDNPEAAQLFIRNLTKKRSDSLKPSSFPGIFDYWISWIAVLVGVITLIKRLAKLRSKG